MTTSELKKDKSIRGVLKRLRSHIGDEAFHVVDNWDADLFAVGIAKTSDHGTLAYISTWKKEPGKYFVELESPPQEGDDLPYRVAASYESVTFGELLDIVSRHLGDTL